MMVKVLVYGCGSGAYVSRKIDLRLHDDFASWVLSAGISPKHRTIRDFRALHLTELSDLSAHVVTPTP